MFAAANDRGLKDPFKPMPFPITHREPNEVGEWDGNAFAPSEIIGEYPITGAYE
jgi:hypothetical protein